MRHSELSAVFFFMCNFHDNFCFLIIFYAISSTSKAIRLNCFNLWNCTRTLTGIKKRVKQTQYQQLLSSFSYKAHVTGPPPQESKHVQTVKSGYAQKYFICTL